MSELWTFRNELISWRTLFCLFVSSTEVLNVGVNEQVLDIKKYVMAAVNTRSFVSSSKQKRYFSSWRENRKEVMAPLLAVRALWHWRLLPFLVTGKVTMGAIFRSGLWSVKWSRWAVTIETTTCYSRVRQRWETIYTKANLILNEVGDFFYFEIRISPACYQLCLTFLLVHCFTCHSFFISTCSLSCSPGRPWRLPWDRTFTVMSWGLM